MLTIRQIRSHFPTEPRRPGRPLSMPEPARHLIFEYAVGVSM